MSASARTRFIVNLFSGGGRTRLRLPKLEEALRRAGFEPDMVFTRYPGHGAELAREAVSARCRTVVAVGGDGTVNEVANGILEAEAGDVVRMGTIGMGTGKDVAKCLGMARAALAIRALRGSNERRIDAGQVALHDVAGAPVTRHFVLEAATGWVPEVSHAVPRRLKLLGDTAPYLLTAFAKMLRPMGREFGLAIDGEMLDGRYNTISLHNMEYWGGDLLVAPGAEPDDGQFDVIRWADMGRRAALQAVQGQRNGGTHLRMEGIDHRRARRLTVSSAKRTAVDLDGELGGYLPATFEVMPSALRFVVP